ncbi:MAG: terpene cyclase/mutase family protein [Fuerstiella sp.]
MNRQAFAPMIPSAFSLIIALLVPASVTAADADLSAMRKKAIQFLEVTQNTDGSWTRSDLVGVSGLVTTSLLKSGLSPEHPLVAKGLAHLISHSRPDGGVYAKDSLHRNYETCIAVMAFTAASSDGRYDDRLKAAEKFLRKLQWDQGEGIESSDPAWGGAGYGSHQRPDMSNTQFLLEALHSAGAGADDPAIKAALKFVTRAQNLETSHNDRDAAGLVNDGGFIYTPANGGESKAGATENGGLRSYGSMTYAGLKSLIYAGMDRSDPRVQAAAEWIRKNYTLKENPGMRQQGLFYYFHTFAKTMDVLGQDNFRDAQGVVHDWKAELTQRLADLQQPNGSWVNPADRWYEGDPNLVTAYCLLALSHCEE